ncbi:MAG: ABC transporter permease [Coprobacillaceae bacterium]
MNYLKRGFLSIIRKPMKSGILFLVVFILGNLMSGSVSIKKTLNKTEENINQNLKPIATVQIDWDTLEKNYDPEKDEEYPTAKPIDEEGIKNIGALEYVEYYDYSMSWSMHSKDLKRYIDPDMESYMYTEPGEPEYFSLHGVERNELLDIQEGKISLKEGRTFTKEDISEGKNYVIVGSNFAEKNGLQVGSTFTLNGDVEEPRDEDTNWETREYKVIDTYSREYEIIGLFDVNKITSDKKDSSSNGGFDEEAWQREMQENTIYLPNNSVISVAKEYADKYAEAGGIYDDTMYFDPIFVLKESKMLDDFREEASSFLPENNIVVDTTKSLENIKKPMESINGIATIVLYASIGVTILILSLLVTLFLHDRRHEMGIYIAMGERKIKVVIQILAEVIGVAMISLTLALIVGNFISKDISKNMLIEQTTNTNEEENYYYSTLDDYTSGVSNEDLIDNYNVSLDAGTILMFYGISVATIVVSTIIPTMYILRLKPKEILM